MCSLINKIIKYEWSFKPQLSKPKVATVARNHVYILCMETVHACLEPSVSLSVLRFSINIGHNADAIALHLNPRFNKNVIVCNSLQGGWGDEHHEPCFPFQQGQEFKVTSDLWPHPRQTSVRALSLLFDQFSSGSCIWVSYPSFDRLQ